MNTRYCTPVRIDRVRTLEESWETAGNGLAGPGALATAWVLERLDDKSQHTRESRLKDQVGRTIGLGPREQPEQARDGASLEDPCTSKQEETIDRIDGGGQEARGEIR